MKKSVKIIIAILILFGITLIIKFNINLLLNKKYAVDEIPFTNRKEGLVGIQEIISDDYVWMLCFNIAFIAILLILLVIVFFKKNKL